jgi:hypothetical protein
MKILIDMKLDKKNFNKIKNYIQTKNYKKLQKNLNFHKKNIKKTINTNKTYFYSIFKNIIINNNNDLKNNIEFINLKLSFKTNKNVMNYNNLIKFLRNNYNMNLINNTKYLINILNANKFSDFELNELNVNDIINYYKLKIEKLFICSYVDDDNNVIFNSSLNDTYEDNINNTNNFYQYINNNIPKINNIKYNHNEQTFIYENNCYYFLSEKIGSNTETEMYLEIIAVILIIITLIYVIWEILVETLEYIDYLIYDCGYTCEIDFSAFASTDSPIYCDGSLTFL